MHNPVCVKIFVFQGMELFFFSVVLFCSIMITNRSITIYAKNDPFSLINCLCTSARSQLTIYV